MNSDRLTTQVLFEDILGSNDYETFKAIKKKELLNFSITKNHVILFQDTLSEDAKDFYYKGLISFSESLISLSNKSFSWATVKMYYAVFYMLRASLCLNEVGFVRQARDLYYFKNDIGNNFIYIGEPDHKASITIFTKLFKRLDFLQSNTIDNRNPYDWIMLQRENVNYKYKSFFEPDIPFFWNSIVASIDSDGWDFWIKRYINEDIYPFLDDHAMLALPIRKLIDTFKKFKQNNILPLRSDKLPRIKELIHENIQLKFLEPYVGLRAHD